MSPLDANLCELKQIFYCHFLNYSENTYYTSPKPRAPFQPCRMIQASHPWISPLILKVYSPLLSHGEVLSPILHGQTILTQPLCLHFAFLPSCQQSKPLDRSKAQEIEFPLPSFSSSVEAGGDSENHIQRCLRESY